MAQQGCFGIFEGADFTKPPILNDIEFWFWKWKMITFIKANDYDMWNIFKNDLDFKRKKDLNDFEKELYALNIRAMKILYSALNDSDFEKVKHCFSAKEIWDTLEDIYATNMCVDCEKTGSSSSAISGSQQVDEHPSKGAENDDQQSVNTSSKEEDFNDELNMEESDNSSIESSLVTDSNPSCAYSENVFEILHCKVSHPIRNSISKIHDSLHVAENECEMNINANNHINPSHSNNCKRMPRITKPVTCNYCGKLGHISHSCFIRKIPNMRNKFVWVPKVKLLSKSNQLGPKLKWVPKCSISSNQVQIIKEHNGTKKNKSSRSSFPLKRRLAKSTSSWRAYGQPIAAYNLTNPKQQWRQTKRSSLMPRKRFIKSSSRRTHGQSKCANKLNPKRKWIKTKEVFISPSCNIIPFNYEEMNKKAIRERRRRTKWKKAQLNLYKNEHF